MDTTDTTQTARGGRRGRLRDRLRLFDDSSRYLDRFGWLLAITLLTIAAAAVVDPADEFDGRPEEVASLLATYLGAATLMLSLSASGVSRAWRLAIGAIIGVGIVVSTAAVVTALLSGRTPPGHPHAAPPIGASAYLLIAFVVVLHRLMHHHTVTRSTLLGTVTAYLFIPLWFFHVFVAFDLLGAEPFFGTPQPRPTFMYFSLTTLTTVGSGLEPVGNVARLLVAAEAVFGQLFLVVFLAMVVGLMAARWQRSMQRERAEPNPAESPPSPPHDR